MAIEQPGTWRASILLEYSIDTTQPGPPPLNYQASIKQIDANGCFLKAVDVVSFVDPRSGMAWLGAHVQLNQRLALDAETILVQRIFSQLSDAETRFLEFPAQPVVVDESDISRFVAIVLPVGGGGPIIEITTSFRVAVHVYKPNG